MTRHVITCFALTGLLGACNPPLDEVDQFRRGVPRRETVEVKLPIARGQALVVEAQGQALRGQTADFYKLTYGVTHLINGGAFFVGALVKAVLRYPPSNITGDTATWGPWTDDLEPITWKVTITRVGEHRYQYAFLGQPRGNPGAPFVTVLSGTHTATIDESGQPMEGFGAGSFTLDWDARNTLPLPNPKETGKAHYTYARPAAAADGTIAAQFRKVRDNEKNRLVDVDYHYLRRAAGGGTMDFTYDAPAQEGMPPGKWAVRSRWQAGGAGRADVRAQSPDLPAPVTASECWDQSFASTYLHLSWAPNQGYGQPAADCVFPTPEFSEL